MTLHRRWLGRIAVALAVAVMVVGAFALGVLVGEMRSPRPVVGSEATPAWPPAEPARPPWPFPPWFEFRRHRGGHGAVGVVERIEDDALVIRGRWDTRVRVVVTKETLFKRGAERIRLADVQEGDRVVILGRPRGEGAIEARVIWVIPEDSYFWEVPFQYPAGRLRPCVDLLGVTCKYGPNPEGFEAFRIGGEEEQI